MKTPVETLHDHKRSISQALGALPEDLSDADQEKIMALYRIAGICADGFIALLQRR